MNTVLETRLLSKRYGAYTAVDALNLHVREGEIYGFLGLNGAGKTTTMRLLLGMIHASGGEAFVLGKKVGRAGPDMWSKVGYMVEAPAPYPELTVFENLEVVRRLRNLGKSEIERVMKLLRIDEYRDRPARKLSLGNGQRLGLAKALMHRPRVLLLDEPVNGLDPEGIADIRELLRTLSRDEGVSILISSHLLDEVSKIADRIGIIHKGRMLQELTNAELERSLDTRLVIDTRDNDQARRVLGAESPVPAPVTGPVVHTGTEQRTGSIELRDIAAIEHPEKVATRLVQAGIPPYRLLVEQEDLEAYFLRSIGEGTANGTPAAGKVTNEKSARGKPGGEDVRRGNYAPKGARV